MYYFYNTKQSRRMDVAIPILQIKKNLSFRDSYSSKVTWLVYSRQEAWNPCLSGSSVRAISTLLHCTLTKKSMQT